MKDFVKMVLAVVCGLFLIGAIGFFLLFATVGAIAAAGSTTPVIPKSGVLKIDMSSIAITEQGAEANPLQSYQQGFSSIGLREAVNAVKVAAQDPGIKYIYLKTDGSLTSLAPLYEFRSALSEFRKSGKAVVSYIESPTTGSYYLSSVADKVYMTASPGATSMVNGVSSRLMFLKDILDKFGVNVQLIRHGKYKSAGEMYTRSEASAENREQYQVLIDSMWETLSSEIAESRGITRDALNATIDELRLCIPQDFVDNGLVDSLFTRQQLEQQLAKLAVEDNFKSVKMISFIDYAKAKMPAAPKGADKIAVIYANGEIIDGSATAQVAGDHFASLVEDVRRDSTIKAVVLRVNSPGGSVLASDKIRCELDLLKADKPVIASYGDYAASGGYWISANCDKIYSDPVTLTGSIGCFGMIPDFSKTLKNVAHINISSINSNKHSDMFTLMRPFDQAEYNYMLRSIEDIYDQFITLVSEGREIPKEQVDAIGQGRVWTGSDALKINLVDEIGTLEDAIAFAAIAAGNPDVSAWNVKSYPAPQTTMEQILAMMNGGNTDDYSVLASRFKNLKEAKIMARMPYEIDICQ